MDTTFGLVVAMDIIRDHQEVAAHERLIIETRAAHAPRRRWWRRG